MDGRWIDSLDVRGSESATDHFHDKFYVFHRLVSFRIWMMSLYGLAVLTAPHSRQRAFRDVINPQEEHILCARNPLACGVTLSLQRSSRMVKSTINTAKEILVAFIRSTLPGKFCNDLHVSTRAELIDSCKIAANGVADRSVAEKPKMGELQMDWLRSEDLKEEKNVTAPIVIIAGRNSR